MGKRLAVVKIITLVGLMITPGLISIPFAYGDPTPIVNIDPSSGAAESQYNGMIGWSFTLQQALTITQVGWYDQGQDGLSRAFQVGLWQGDGGASMPQLLGTPAGGITIPGGTSAALEGVWSVVDLPAPLTLQPGDYVLAGYDTAATSDVIYYVGPLGVPGIPSPPMVTVPGLTIDLIAWGPLEWSSGFQNPSGFELENGLELGPMLFTNDPVTPEPATMGLMAAGLAALAARRRRAGR